MTAEVNNHEAWRERAALHALGALEGEDYRSFQIHLQSCTECASEVSSLQPVIGALANAVPQYDPPYELRARVLAAAGRTVPPEIGGRWDSAALVVRPTSKDGGSMRWTGLAAAAVLSVGLAGYSYVLRGRVASLESQLNQALAESAARLAQVESTRRVLNSTQSRLDVLAAPDTARIALTGQAPAPNATGRADWSRSLGLALSAVNLPALQPGRTYQIWLLTAGAPVSAGMVRPDEAGRVSAVYPTPADVPEPTGVALSEEPDGGVAQPTGQIYLVGGLNRSG